LFKPSFLWWLHTQSEVPFSKYLFRLKSDIPLTNFLMKVVQLSVILAALSLSLFIKAHYTFAGHCGLQSEYLSFYTVKPTTLRWLGQPIITSMIHVGFWILWRRWHPHCSVYCCWNLFTSE
jgi:hypothetical protein